MENVKFVDLFAGIGGIRKGFELACQEANLKCECVLTSEIKQSAIEILKQNHPNEVITGDITTVKPNSIPDFDVLLAGFPCQAFSSAGRRQGFNDTRGTLFFNVANILKAKRPSGFILENVPGLVNHDMAHAKPNSKIGHTLQVILNTLSELGYHYVWRVFNAIDFGVPQSRKRIYIVGSLNGTPNLDGHTPEKATLGSILETGLPVSETEFAKTLIEKIGLSNLPGKSCKDKRGGINNVHSWDLELKGHLSDREKTLLNKMLTERRKRKWADEYGIHWMDGMPLTLEMIKTFVDYPGLQTDLENCVRLGYLKYEHPKRLVEDGNGATHRSTDESLPKGYNIVSGKMSFEVNKILDPKGCAPTLVAMDMQGLYVVDGNGIRNLSLREGLRLFGYPEDFKFDIKKYLGYDLLGNTVVVPVIKFVASRLLNTIYSF